MPKACAQAWRSCVRQLHPADAPSGARHAFALAGQEEEEPLYLSASSEADRLAWMRALSCSASAAPCDVLYGRATLLSFATLRALLLASLVLR